MSLFKRQARRVAVVGVGVALLVLGLEAPAFAAAPVISSFTPDSGAAAGGCVIVVTGTALDDFATATWTFENAAAPAPSVAAADYVLVSDTEAWVTAPALASGFAYKLKIVNDGGDFTSTGTFLATAGAGNCAPTITSIKPACGSTNDKVVITGTNLLLDGAAANDTAGGTVTFKPYTITATVVFPDTDTSTQLSRFVTSEAQDGPIKVVAGGGTVFSTESFQVPPPDCAAALPFARGITLRLRDALVARGKVTASSATAPAGCTAAVPVKIQRRRAGGGWRTVGSTTTSDTGGYRKKIRNRHGKYRSLAPKLTLASGDVCSRAVSKVVRH
jgi:IPT/TIG domain